MVPLCFFRIRRQRVCSLYKSPFTFLCASSSLPHFTNYLVFRMETMYAYPHNRQLHCHISKLPVELLMNVFSMSTHLPQPEYGGPDINSESVKVPLTLSRVNKHWRQVALRSQDLWTSLCITNKLIDSGMFTTHITSYLALSQNSPLNIHIYTAEGPLRGRYLETPSENGIESYTPPTSSDHMSTIVSLLIPHLSRWKSLTMTTDTWPLMHTTLTSINAHIALFRAPRLEWLELCCEDDNLSPEFQPEKATAFLQRGRTTASHRDLLPRLNDLSLTGVHVDWDSLVDSLSATETGLVSFLIHSQRDDVRPSLDQFHKILSSSPGLKCLSVHNSFPDDYSEAVRGYAPVHLPHLCDISIRYCSKLEGYGLLSLLDAPNARELTFVDDAQESAEEVDASSMLMYLGTKEFIADATIYDSDSDGPQTDTRRDQVKPRGLFPMLEKVTLQSVIASPRALRAFFDSLPNLEHLELVAMDMYDLHILLPTLPSPPTLPPSSPAPAPAPALLNCSCPCPQLRSLTIRPPDSQLTASYLRAVVTSLFAAERQHRGKCGLLAVNIRVCSGWDVTWRVLLTGARGKSGLKVYIFNDNSDNKDEEEYEHEYQERPRHEGEGEGEGMDGDSSFWAEWLVRWG
ncbi:hypothetical protein B0H34DRAFT_432952 [Crassisporium funariophilum]|nr:hypothetical protein B0H34DRAFT_432952 [Crassisporium funariophilum]